MEATHLQAHGGNASSAMTSSILLHCAANLAAIHSVATAGVAKMCVKCEACDQTYFCKHNQRLTTGEVVRCEYNFLWVQTCMLCQGITR